MFYAFASRIFVMVFLCRLTHKPNAAQHVQLPCPYQNAIVKQHVVPSEPVSCRFVAVQFPWPEYSRCYRFIYSVYNFGMHSTATKMQQQQQHRVPQCSSFVKTTRRFYVCCFSRSPSDTKAG